MFSCAKQEEPKAIATPPPELPELTSQVPESESEEQTRTPKEIDSKISNETENKTRPPRENEMEATVFEAPSEAKETTFQGQLDIFKQR